MSAPVLCDRSFHLRVFGGLQLSPPHGATAEEIERTAVLDNRKRVLAVLAVLALSDRVLTREQLADYFWGDSDPARARHSLAEALSALRRLLGDDAISSRSTDVQLMPSAPLECDARHFLDARRCGDHRRAVGLYTADFLDGVHVERAARFEQWTDRQRDTLRGEFAESCAVEVRALFNAGEHQQATRLARRWLDASPLSVEAAEAWLRAVLAPGTQEAVHRARADYEQYRLQLEAEYELSPEPRLTRLVADAEQALAARSVPRHDTTVLETGPTRPRTPVTSSPSAPDAALVGKPTAGSSRAIDRPASWRMRSSLRLVSLGAVVGLGAIWASRRGNAADDVSTLKSRSLVVVADAENATRDTLLGHAITLAITTGIDESAALQAVPAGRVQALRALMGNTAAKGLPLSESMARTIATRAGASLVAVPVVVSLGARYRVALRVVRAANGEFVASVQSAATTSDELLLSIDRLLRDVRIRLGGSLGERERARPLPDYTTGSLEALLAYVAGVRAFNREQYREALAHYEQASRLDSTFALAWHAQGRTLAASNEPQAADTAFSRAERLLDRLTPREQIIVRAGIASARGMTDSAIALRARWIETHPDELELQRVQVFDLLSRSRFREAVAVSEQIIRRDTTDEVVWTNLALAYPGDDLVTRRKAVAAFSRAIALDTTAVHDALFSQRYGGLLVRAQMYDSAARIFAAQAGENPSVRGRAFRSAGQLALWRGRPADAVAPLRQAVAASTVSGEALSRSRSRLWLTYALSRAGQQGEADVHLDSLVKEAPEIREPQVHYWIGQALVRAGRLNDAQRVFRAQSRWVLATSPLHLAAQTLLKAEIAAATGDARSTLKDVATAVSADSSLITLETHAWVRLQSGDTVTARQQLLSIVQSSTQFGTESWISRDRARSWLGRIGEARAHSGSNTP